MYSRIAGTGSYLPKKTTNADLERLVDTSDEWIRTRTGIEQRHVAAEGETTTDLAEHAARRAILDAGVTAEDIDLICVGTTTPDLVFPNVGTLLQDRLGIHGCPAFSLEAACTGFVYALSVADKFVRQGESKCAWSWWEPDANRRLAIAARVHGQRRRRGADTIERAGRHQHAAAFGRQIQDLLLYPDGVSKGFDLVRQGKAGVQMKGNEVCEWRSTLWDNW
jgi:3-oxoacyl-[acyl-carrier-protein] synthase-3